MTRHLALIVAYLGDAADDGWQRQNRPGAASVQGALEAALAGLHDGAAVRVRGAGRTDAGVHSRGQIATAHVRDDVAPRQWVKALNGALPDGIRVLWAAWAPDDFRPRHDVGAKTYTYRFCVAPVCPPRLARNHWWVPGRLDLGAAAAVAAAWRGRHDFAATCSRRASPANPNTIRTVERCELHDAGETATFVVRSRGFLMHQVRIMAGTLVHVARGAASADAVLDAFARGERRGLGPTAPAHGLTLNGVDLSGLAEHWHDGWPTPLPPTPESNE